MKRNPRSVLYVSVSLIAAVGSAVYLVIRHPAVPDWQAALIGAGAGVLWSVCFLAAFFWAADRGYFEFFLRRRRD